jgi:hypothetical protein
LHKQFQIKDGFSLPETSIGVPEHRLYSEYLEFFGKRSNIEIFQNFKILLKKEHNVAFFLNDELLREYFEQTKKRYNGIVVKNKF